MTRLLRSELLRLRSRRAVRWLALATIGALVLLGVQAVNEATRTQGAADWVFAEKLPEGANIVAGLLSVCAFLMGATYAGADWAAGTVQSLLTWEPRRFRVVVAKAVALAVTITALGVLLLGAVTGIAALASSRGGTFDGAPDDLWRTVALADLRALALGILMAWLAFAIASLTRNTGVALGVGFVYFAILEQLLRVVAQWLNPYLIGNAIAIWIGGRMRIDSGGSSTFEFTRPAAAAVLVAYSVGLLAFMTALFARRDVS